MSAFKIDIAISNIRVYTFELTRSYGVSRENRLKIWMASKSYFSRKDRRIKGEKKKE